MTIKLDGLTLKELHSLRAKIDVAIQKLKVMFVADRAGLVEDGPTHSGVFDISFCDFL